MMNRSIPQNQREIVNTILNGLDITWQSTGSQECRINCYYRNNRDGSIRWIWPKEADKPEFLRFYYKASLRSRVFTFIIQFLFRFKCAGIFAHGEFTFYTNSEHKILKGKKWAIFTGTVGINRKGIVWKQLSTDQSGFHKIPIGEMASFALKNEEHALKYLKSYTTDIIKAPILIKRNGKKWQTDICTKTTKSPKSIIELPKAQLAEWLLDGIHIDNRAFSYHWQKASKCLGAIRSANDNRIPYSILSKLDILSKQLCNENEIAFNKAHGDFTSWNIFYSKDHLHIIDWEMFNRDMPAFYDAFHFIYQQSILVDRLSFSSIRKKIDAFFNQSYWSNYLIKYGINVDTLEKHYLFYTITNSLYTYINQSAWHEQIRWLIEVWNEALNFWITDFDPSLLKNLFIRDLFQDLKPFNYALMKSCGKLPWAIDENSDLDICISNTDAKHIINKIKQHQFIKEIQFKRLSYMKAAEIVLTDNSIVYIDFIHQFKVKAIEFLDRKRVLSNTRFNAFDIKTPSIQNDFLYTWLFYTLNDSRMPDHYNDYFIKNLLNNRVVLNQVANEYCNMTFTEMLASGKSMRNSSIKKIKRNQLNRNKNGLFNRLRYAVDVINSFFVKPGFIVTFSGVDGSGKSTIINELKERINKSTRRRIIVLRHRPSLLPIISSWKYGKKAAEKRSISTNPCQGKNTGKINSLIRFAYYYVDYFIGQFYIYCRYIMRGDIVIYDRYYFDFIANPERSNLKIPQWITLFCYRFLIKPKFNFFLYASTESILARKRELNEKMIEQLTEGYLSLFSKLEKNASYSNYTSIYNLDIIKTISSIQDVIKSKAI